MTTISTTASTPATGPKIERVQMGPVHAVSERADRRSPFIRLCRVEMRKFFDTPSGAALAGTSLAFALLAGGGCAYVQDNATFGRIIGIEQIPLMTLLPVFAIILATSGRQHRTSLQTYALVPSRGRVLGAQLCAVLALALVAVLITTLLAAIITPVASIITGRSVPWSIGWDRQVINVVGLLISSAMGFCLGLALRLAPAAITLVLVWPTLSLFLGLIPGAPKVLAWFDMNAVAAFINEGVSADKLAHLAVSILVWVVLPGIVGVVFELRREVR